MSLVVIHDSSYEFEATILKFLSNNSLAFWLNIFLVSLLVFEYYNKYWHIIQGVILIKFS